jgi:hypothetical protein
MSLTFNKFAETNLDRCETAFHPIGAWSPTDWATALAGELGDVVIYADLLATALGGSLEKSVVYKFNVVSDRYKVDIKL